MKTLSKVILRQLPKNLTENEFLEQISHLNLNYYYFRFCSSSRRHGDKGSSRAYFGFKNEDDVYVFHKLLKSHVFKDSDGIECCGIIEFAAFQKIPSPGKLDSKENTIENDPEFLKFCEEENSRAGSKGIGTNAPLESMLEELKLKEAEKSVSKTALLDYLEKEGSTVKSTINRKKESEEITRIIVSRSNIKKKEVIETISTKESNKYKKMDSAKDDNTTSSSNRSIKNTSKNDSIPSKHSKSRNKRLENRAYVEPYDDYDLGHGPYSSSRYNDRYYYGNSYNDPYYQDGYSDPYYSTGRSQQQSYYSSNKLTSKGKSRRPPPSYSATRKD